ncbi:hypothetical protein DWB85_01100 [Seongchinamella sediminis]|uniref:Sigma-54 factor interaction domain-containing protein n=1 Tax=Seongchinamella sediminis TaxID=2283635 RepID=A0A3L7E3P3_9GAMM|nr:sigma 54-interacting transcriptional regulator [Seongchinamella sediminis]RLQ23779.1 hypothetical protein DWB85_01100 [Seongchinamella sediminis]
MTALDQHYKEIGTCLVIVDRGSQLVLASFGKLPFVVGDGLVGRDWRDALAIPADSTAVVSQAIIAGIAAALPPLIVGAGADGDLLMAGLLAPQRWQGADAVLMFLRPLHTPWGMQVEEQVQPEDIVAVLGVDRLEFSPAWGVPETEGLMMELRVGLQQILRDEDWLGLPEGSTIAVVLRGLDLEAALDVSRALSSHLHQFLAGCSGGAQYARACIGLSQRLEGQPALSALVAANGALLQAQAGSEERIRYSSPWDPLAQAARALSATGIFRDAAIDPRQRQLLADLVALPPPTRRLDDYAARVLALVLAQPGLAAAALLQFLHDGQADCLAAATATEGDVEPVAPSQLPKAMQALLRQLDIPTLSAGEPTLPENIELCLLRSGGHLVGALLVLQCGQAAFLPGAGALQHLATLLYQGRQSKQSVAKPAAALVPAPREMEKGIQGYVLDNMEGAIDQAMFLARVNMPVAVEGERGTGKYYVAQVVHNASGGDPDGLVRLDCRSFRTRSEAWATISRELRQGDGRTLAFKSPQLLHMETQGKLARQLATRTTSDDGGSQYLARNRYVGLFPASLATLVERRELDPRLASVFGGYPIRVPPLRERPRAVLRWAHKILEQESTQQDRRISGFTPDAEQALLRHSWPGNISEMREMIRAAVERTDKEWVTPVDLGLFVGISADGLATPVPEQRPFLSARAEVEVEAVGYSPSVQEELRLALGQALAASLETGVLRPLGAWLDDELIEAALDRCGGDGRGAAEYLQTRNRNIGRWLPRVKASGAEREASLLWQESRRLVREWVMESVPPEQPPQQVAQDMLLALVLQQCSDTSVADRATIMGVSTPTYQKRVKQLLEDV